MTTAEHILNQSDIMLAIKQKRALNKVETIELQNKLASSFKTAFSPVPRTSNKVDFALNIARNAFSLWQGITIGMKVVKGFKSAFNKK